MSDVEVTFTEKESIGPPKTHTRTAKVKFPIREIVDMTREAIDAGDIGTPTLAVDAILNRAAKWVSGGYEP